MAYQNYVDERIDTCVSSQFRRVASGRTEIVELRNGAEVRSAVWRHKPYSFSASFDLLTPEAQIAIASVFHVVDARCYLFRFQDPGDNDVVDSPLTVIAGTRTPAQLTKRYYFGALYSDRMIQAIDTCVVKDEIGTPVDGVLDDALGLFTPDANWGAGPYTWSGTFDVWVRFASDDFDMTMETLEIATSDVELVERRAVRVD